jgi:hypothetical protein
VRRSSRTWTTGLDLVVLAESEATARDLATRETSCCSFFRFDFEHAPDGLLMRIGVPRDHIDVLDALQARICSVAGIERSTARSETGLRSGEVADAGGVNVQTLRYCERSDCCTNRTAPWVVTGSIRPKPSRCCA